MRRWQQTADEGNPFFNSGSLSAKPGSKWVRIDTSGSYVINPQYEGLNIVTLELGGIAEPVEG